MKMFDSHAHYDDARFDGVRDEVLAEVHASGVERIVNIGSSLASSRACIDLAQKYDFIYASVGIHPSDAARDMQNENYISLVEDIFNSSPKVVAIGEIGLDYHYGKDDKEIQKICFDEQMSLASKLGCPVVIHDREAHGDTLDILSAHPDVTGVLHSFSGSFEMACRVLEMGYYVSVNGVITFENAKKTVEIMKNIKSIMPGALDRILMETDCPYLTPVPFRGKTNRSDLMVYTAAKAAECLGMSTEEFCELTYRNACRFYGIPEQKEKL